MGSIRGAMESRIRSADKRVAGLVVGFQMKLTNHAIEIAGQGGEVLESLNGFFGALRILSRELRDVAGGLGDFAGGGSLLSCGGGDEMDLVFDLLGRFDGGLKALLSQRRFADTTFDSGAAVLHDLEGAAGLILNAANGCGDFFSSSLGAFGQTAHFACDNGEAATMLTSASGFDGCVQSQQVGLLTDFLNDADDFADFLGALGKRVHLFGDSAGGFGDLLHGGCGGLHYGSALVGSFRGETAGMGSAFCVVADLANGCGHF